MIKTRDKRPALFAEGETVKIRSRDSITATLNPLNKLDGCLFFEEMLSQCGREQTILKVVNNYFDEYKLRMYKVKSPLYLMKGLVCSGEVDTFEHRCDHSCYLLWHEEWLEKI